MKRLLLVLAAVGVACAAAFGAEPGAEEAAIRKTVASYVAAFNRADAAAVTACWTTDGQFTAASGRTFQGHEAIQKGLEDFFKGNQGAKLDVEIASIRVQPNGTAVEEGTTRVTLPGQPPSETGYVARYVKQGDDWKLKSVTESEAAPSHYEQLKELEWMIGEWTDKDKEEHASIQVKCKWTKNKNFITRSFAVTIGDRVDLEGTQVIGWDPAKKVIRSWLFDSDGGFGVGIWSNKGKQWTVEALQVLPDGRKASSVNVLTQVDDNTFTWESTGREVGGEVLPNVGPVTVVRKQNTK